MVSLKRVAQECLGLSGTISVDRDVYGYIFRDSDDRLFGQLLTASDIPPSEAPERLPDTLPGTGQPTDRSLRQHLQSIKGKSINLSILMIGYDDFSGDDTLDDLTKVQYAIQIARDLYVQADLGIRRIFWSRRSVAEAGDFTEIADKDEAEALTDAFSGDDNDGIDVFWVRMITGAGGFCNEEGPCEKDSSDGLTGVVIELNRRRRRTGILLAHELGHYLGLPGGSSLTNIMGMAQPGQPDDLQDVSTEITSSQAADMRDHCFVRPAC